MVRELGPINSASSKLCYVPTATYVYDPSSPRAKGEQRRRARYEAKQKMAQLSSAFGLEQSALLELDAPTLSEQKLRDALSNANVVYVDGGNTFYLQYYLQKTNFWPLLAQADVGVYIGSSAGGICAARSCATALWKGWDDPNIFPATPPSSSSTAAVEEAFEWNERTLAGRNLARGDEALGDFSVFMHHAERFEELVASKAPSLGHNVVCLRDDEALVLRKGETRAMLLHADGRIEEPRAAAIAHV